MPDFLQDEVRDYLANLAMRERHDELYRKAVGGTPAFVAMAGYRANAYEAAIRALGGTPPPPPKKGP